MENATQALLIAAGVLIGVLILSLAVFLFSFMGGHAAEIQNKIDEDEIAQFNNKFLKYNGLKNLTMQDIITVKNYALENNKKYDFYNASTDRARDNNDYIDVYYDDNKSRAHTLAALIFNKNDETLLKDELEKVEAGKKMNRFTCEVEVNSGTGRVNKIYFYET